MTEPRSAPWTSRGAAAGGSPSTLTPPRGVAPVRRRAGTPWWLWTVLALLALAGVLIGTARCGTDRDAARAAAGAAAPAVGIPGAGVPTATVPSPAGSLTAGATSVFDAARAGGLTPLVGQTVIGHAVPVQSVDADEGFWIGTGPTDRVWVQLATSSESAVTITAGQLLDLSGPLVSHGADFARKAGVTAQEGAEQLTREGAHLEVDPKLIKVVGTR